MGTKAILGKGEHSESQFWFGKTGKQSDFFRRTWESLGIAVTWVHCPRTQQNRSVSGITRALRTIFKQKWHRFLIIVVSSNLTLQHHYWFVSVLQPKPPKSDIYVSGYNGFVIKHVLDNGETHSIEVAKCFDQTLETALLESAPLDIDPKKLSPGARKKIQEMIDACTQTKIKA